jgi:murein DD-endopeptidase MepM/ murein hydrolase activator NlpD
LIFFKPSSQTIKLFILAILMMAAIPMASSGCVRPAAPEAAAAVESAAVVVQQGSETAVLPTPTLAMPVVSYNNEAAPPPPVVEAPPTSMPSFALADPDQLTRQAEVTPTETPALSTAEVSVPPTATVEPTSEATNTPQPTFTPPALAFTSIDEHYWFRRPIPEGGTVWTDKVYPYGSTKGGTLRTHHGVEFYVAEGTEVLAVASGTVIVAGDDSAYVFGPHANFYGNLIVIEHDSLLNGEKVYTLYAHLSDIFVAEGQRVDSLQIIAYSGATGVADGPHLHFEVRLGENSYNATRNPLLWLYPFPDRGTIVGRVTWPDGSEVNEAPVRLNRVDASSRYLATTTYADTGVNPDPEWNENFAIDDVDAGFYEVIVDTGDKKYEAEVWVYPYRTSFVEIVIDN